jgi:hypothetical protein
VISDRETDDAVLNEMYARNVSARAKHNLAMDADLSLSAGSQDLIIYSISYD